MRPYFFDWPLFIFFGRNSYNSLIAILENFRHQHFILKQTDLYLINCLYFVLLWPLGQKSWKFIDFFWRNWGLRIFFQDFLTCNKNVQVREGNKYIFFTSVLIRTTLFFRKAWQMFAESIGNTAKLFFAVSCQSAEEFAEGHCCDSRALLNLAIMGEPAHNGVHYFLK